MNDTYCGSRLPAERNPVRRVKVRVVNVCLMDLLASVSIEVVSSGKHMDGVLMLRFWPMFK